MKKTLLFVLLLFVFTAALAQEQAPLPALDITGVNPTDLPTATITVEVLDSSGQPVPGLTEADFTLSGELADFAEITSVENVTDSNLTFTVVLVIDTSQSMGTTGGMGPAREAAAQFVNSIGDNDPVALIAFSSDVRLVQDLTTDKAALLESINSLTASGQTDLYAAALAGIEKAAETPSPRRAVILLSDGQQYLDDRVSAVGRNAALERAKVLGVPVYTIGLGSDFDRSYMISLSNGTNARYSETGNPEILTVFYSDLARLFRSQYVITLNVDVPLDGTEYDFTLQANTPNGITNEDSAVLRAPIPIPLVNVDPKPETALTESTTFTATVKADDPFAGVDVALDGGEATNIAAEPFTFTVDPFTFSPGEHTLNFSVTDETGDSGSDEVTFEVAALPAKVTLSVDFSTVGEIVSSTTVMVDVEEQTATTGVTFSVDDEVISDVTEAPYSADIDPLSLEPGEHTLSIEVTSESGATTTIEETFTVAALPPEVVITGIEADELLTESRTISVDVGGQTAGEQVTFSIDGEVVATDTEAPFEFELDPLTVSPDASHTLEITAENAGGQSATVETTFITPPLATATPTPTPTTDFESTNAAETAVIQSTTDAQSTLDADTAATSDAQSTTDAQSTAEAQATTEAASTTDAQAAIDEQATTDADATANAELTAVAESTSDAQSAIDAEATTDAISTVNADLTVAAQLTADTRATNNAQATANAQGTANARATQQVEATNLAAEQQLTADAARETAVSAQQSVYAKATADAQATLDARTTATESDETTAAMIQQETLDVEQTGSAVPTEESTPEPTDTEEVLPTATVFDPTATPNIPSEVTAPTETSSLPTLAIILGIGLLVLLILFFLLGRRPRS